MATSQQVIGHGSQLKMGSATGSGSGSGSGSAESFTPILGVTSIDFGSNKVDSVGNTEMLTPGNTHTFIPGMEDPGDVTIKLNVHPGDPSQASLRESKGTAMDFQAIAPAGAWQRAFSGFVTGFDVSIPDDKLPTISVKIKVTGPITETNF